MKRRLISAAFVACVLSACTASPAPNEPPASPTTITPWPSDGATTTAQPAVTFTLVSAGDVLPHTSLFEAAKTADGYDFTPNMAASKPFVEGADIALCSLEVPIAPEGTKPSGYPMFGAPKQLIGDLKTLGWDGCTFATNHTADRGWDGLKTTLDAFDAAGLGVTGVGRTNEERLAPRYYRVEKDGRAFTLAHVSGTYGLNGMPDPGKKQGFQAVNMLEDIADAAKRAKDAGADIVIASPHWGIEYQMKPNDEQRAIGQQLADTGVVDAIIGTHPHVPQEVAELAGKDGKKVPIVYSTGNFWSGQDEKCCTRETATGLITQLAITVDDDGARVGAMKYTPVTMDLDARRHHFMLSSLVDGERPKGVTLKPDRIKARWDALLKVMGDERLEKNPPKGGAKVTLVDAPKKG